LVPKGFVHETPGAAVCVPLGAFNYIFWWRPGREITPPAVRLAID